MESPFDIAADLDTPVSAYMKLKAFGPCFLLESVESGERLARYSFVGLGSRITVELHADRLTIDGKAAKRPANAAEWLALMRDVLGRAPTLHPEIDGIPFNGGLVGTTGYDVVRFFERLPDNARELEGLPQAVYVAPESLLVFDHLTRRVALLHAGSESERQALRARVVKALRGGLEAPDKPGAFSQAAASMTEREFIAAVAAAKAHIKAGDIYQIVLSVRFSGRTDLDPFQTYRGLRLLNPSPYMYFFELGELARRGLLARGARAARWPNREPATDRRHAAARRRRPSTIWRSSTSCSPIRRRTRSTSCSSISRATIWGASRARARCTSTRTARSSATATSCTS